MRGLDGGVVFAYWVADPSAYGVVDFDEQGQAATASRKIEICTRAYRLLVDIGFPPEDNSRSLHNASLA